MEEVLRMRRILLVLLFLLALPVASMGREKVILDTDMVELFDDGIAMVMLANSPKIDLLGVVTVAGNTWAEEGTAYGVRQLEIIGREDIPVAQGFVEPLRAGRLETLPLERQMFGIGPSKYVGAFGHERPASWSAFYKKAYGKESPTRILEQHGADFIIEQVKKFPGEVTIAAIGPCTNVAFAIRKAPEIVPMIKRVIYMGGAFEVQGNTTPSAEFNWWFDPEAAKMAVRAPFKEQIVVGLDVCEKVLFTKKQYEKLIGLPRGYPDLVRMFKERFDSRFAKDPKYRSFVWDLIVSAILIDPTIVKEEKTEWIDVNSEYTVDYGRSLGYAKQGPAGTRKARIIFTIDETKFWQMMYELIQRPKA